MKKTLITTLLITACITSTSFAKPGGWIKDFFQGSSFSYSSTTGYYPQNQVYYERPVYYQPRVVVYERPQYYVQPRPVPMQPYQNFNYQWRGGKSHHHCH